MGFYIRSTLIAGSQAKVDVSSDSQTAIKANSLGVIAMWQCTLCAKKMKKRPSLTFQAFILITRSERNRPCTFSALLPAPHIFLPTLSLSLGHSSSRLRVTHWYTLSYPEPSNSKTTEVLSGHLEYM